MVNYFHLPMRGARLLLAGFRDSVRLTQPSEVNSIPEDPRTVLSRFTLDPITQVYACCPQCYALYEYASEEARRQIPEECSRGFESDPTQVCGTPLWKTEYRASQARRVPVLKYEPQDFKHWLGRLLCRPGIETVLKESFRRERDVAAMSSYWDGDLLWRLSDKDRNFFFPGPNDRLRLAFGISTDSFNPFHVKAAKQSVSCTGIWIFCLNLPPHLVFLPENVCLVGVVPGPEKPSVNHVDHTLDRVVDVFEELFDPGVKYTKTFESSTGRLVQAMLVYALADMLEARRLGGFSAVTSRRFCVCCDLENKDIENLDKSTWPKRDVSRHKKIAILWRDADSQEKRDEIFGEHGIRWTPFLRLPYWDPIRFTGLEVSHLLFAGLSQHHVRDAFGINLRVQGGLFLPERPHGSVDMHIRACYEKIKENFQNLLSDLQNSYKKTTLLYVCKDLDLRHAGTKYQMSCAIVEWVSTVWYRQQTVIDCINIHFFSAIT
jgi:hypothetical protein